jgi:hypothetical protein
MIPLLINQSIISRDFSLKLSKCLADSDLVVTGLTGIGPIRKISVLTSRNNTIISPLLQIRLRDQFGTVFIIAIAALIKKMSDVDARIGPMKVFILY